MFQLSPIILFSVLLGLVRHSSAQYPPYDAYDSILKSPINPNITISYKTPDPGTCTTVYEKQKQYTGYVNLPPFTLAPYQQNTSINTFFWFIEARNNPETAPLAIWLNGGPGSSSMLGLFTESGPCQVVQLPDGSYGTQSNLWGWDRSANVLYIDQPTQVGFSYDELRNASLDLLTGQMDKPKAAYRKFPTLLNGTFPSGNEYGTQNTSVIAASASWHFLQGFLSAFPQYNPGVRPDSNNTEPTGINLFAESYGGQYGPAFAHYFESQNGKRITGDIPRNSTLEIKLTSLGIINGLVDELVQAPWWVKFAFDNNYGIQAIDQTTELNALSDFNSANGCRELITQCRDSISQNDPLGEGDEDPTNKLCAVAKMTCSKMLSTALSTGRNPYDIASMMPDSAPGYAFLEYLNTAEVLQSIGAKVNFTQNNLDVYKAYMMTGDEVRGTQMTSLAGLLTLGVRVAFMYGDADIICNWRGGEDVSLQVARLLPTYSTPFPAAGYADIVVNDTYVGGQVRQYGNLSFSRIYDAGHTIPSYQPETAFVVFTRIIEGTDIGLGKEIDLSKFSTQGKSESTYQNKPPKQPDSVCWIRDIDDTCSDEQADAIAKGQGVVLNGVWYSAEKDFTPPLSTMLAGKPGSLPPSSLPTSKPTTTSSVPVTGVFTATGTPKAKSAASSLKPHLQLLDRGLFHHHHDKDGRYRHPVLRKALIVVGSVLGSLLLLSLIGIIILWWALLRGRKITLPKLPILGDMSADSLAIDKSAHVEFDLADIRNFLSKPFKRPATPPTPPEPAPPAEPEP